MFLPIIKLIFFSTPSLPGWETWINFIEWREILHSLWSFWMTKWEIRIKNCKLFLGRHPSSLLLFFKSYIKSKILCTFNLHLLGYFFLKKSNQKNIRQAGNLLKYTAYSLKQCKLPRRIIKYIIIIA